MSMQSDRHGFLVGQPLGDGGSDRVLGAIKRDTGSILAAMRNTARLYTKQATAVPTGRMAAGSVQRIGQGAMPLQRTAMPFSRASVAPDRLRDASGRFMAAPAAPAGRDSRAVVTMADAAQAMARTAETQRREDKRNPNGTFAGGDNPDKPKREPKGGPGGQGAAGAIGSGAAVALNASENIDPLIGAANEIKGLVTGVKGVVGPIGRGLFGGKSSGDDRAVVAEERKQTGLLKEVVKTLKAGGTGGGLLGGGGMLTSMVGPAIGAAGAALGAAFLGVLRKIPILAGLLALNESSNIDADKKLTPQEKTEAQAGNVGGVAGMMSGAAIGAGFGSAFMPGIGTAIGGLAGGAIGYFGGSAAGKAIGSGIGGVSAMFESGGRGAGTVSSGAGDAGGASYGTHQLSSKAGTLQKFLGSSGYGDQFTGMQPGTPEFDAKWKRVAQQDPKFGQAQQDFMSQTHYEPQMAKLKAGGMDLSGRGDAVKEAVFSTATQFGPNSSVIQQAMAGRDVAKMSDADFITSLQDHKAANNASLFRSSAPNVQASTLKRASAEKDVLLARIGQAPTAEGAGPPGSSMLSMPRAPAVSAPVAVPAPPQIDTSGPTRINTDPPAAPPAAPAPPPGQDVRDRTIAHVVTGGIGGAMTYR